MAALRIHQHGIDDMRIALPLPPLAFRPARQIGRIAALEHDAFDGFGVLAGARSGGIASCGGQSLPAIEGNRRR